MELLDFDERLEYIAGLNIVPESDIFSLDGINYNGRWYIGGKISTGEIISESYVSLSERRFDFGDLGKFNFPDNTIRDVRRKDLIEKYELKNGRHSGEHLENLFGMSWEQIWKIILVNSDFDKPVVL